MYYRLVMHGNSNIKFWDQFFVSPDLSAWFLTASSWNSCIAVSDNGHCGWWFTWPPYYLRVSASCLNCHLFFISLFFFTNCSKAWIFPLSWSEYIAWNHPPHFRVAFMRKSVWMYVASKKVAGLRTTSDVTWGGGRRRRRGLYEKEP